MTDDARDAQVWLSMADAGRRLREGSLTSERLTETLLARCQRYAEPLNVFRLPLAERAMALARAADLQLGAGQDLGPLHGMPYGLKDIFDVAGLPTSAGWAKYNDRVMDADSAAHASLARAGMVLLGKTNTVQFASGYAGINHSHGTPHNPWHQVPHLPGGSSSGSAVGLAAGLFPMGLGSDTGGSIRCPASLCGTVGLKTTVGRLSRAGAFPLSPTLDSVGPLTRTVEDAALVFMAMQGPDAADPTTLGVPPLDVLSALQAGVKGLRIAYLAGPFHADADPEVVATVEATREVFARLGAQVEQVDLPEVAAAVELRGTVSQTEAYQQNEARLTEHFDEIDPIVSKRLIVQKDTLAVDHVRAVAAMEAAQAAADRALQDWDAVITPTTRQAALPTAEVDATFETYLGWSTKYTNTNFGNVLKLCGVSVPCGFTKKGLPVGLQVCSRAFREDLALRIAHAYEQATEWHQHHPTLDWIG